MSPGRRDSSSRFSNALAVAASTQIFERQSCPVLSRRVCRCGRESADVIGVVVLLAEPPLPALSYRSCSHGGVLKRGWYDCRSAVAHHVGTGRPSHHAVQPTVRPRPRRRVVRGRRTRMAQHGQHAVRVADVIMSVAPVPHLRMLQVAGVLGVVRPSARSRLHPAASLSVPGRQLASACLPTQ